MDLPGEAEGTETSLALLPTVHFFPIKATGCGPSSHVSCHGCTDMAEQDLSLLLIQIGAGMRGVRKGRDDTENGKEAKMEDGMIE